MGTDAPGITGAKEGAEGAVKQGAESNTEDKARCAPGCTGDPGSTGTKAKGKAGCAPGCAGASKD